MSLTFNVSNVRKHFQTNPGNYIKRLIVHEGKRGLNFHLKKKAWVTSVDSGLCLGAYGFNFFQIHLNLSWNGLEKVSNPASLARTTELAL